MTTTPEQIAAAVADARKRGVIGRPSARRTGRNPEWPYVPVIITVNEVGTESQKQILGKAFKTRTEAVEYADSVIERWYVDLAKSLADPRYRALRQHYGLPRELA